MEAEIGLGRPYTDRIPSYTDQSVLILNQNSAPCAAAKCDSLLPLLQKSLRLKRIQEQRPSRFRFPDKLSSAPDLILLRSGIGEAAQDLIQSCKEKGNVSFFKHKLEHSLELKFSKIVTESLLREE